MRLKKGNVERIAETPEQIAKLQNDGFKAMDEETATPAENLKDMTDMTVAQLRELAKEKNLPGCESLSKAELITVLKGVV